LPAPLKKMKTIVFAVVLLQLLLVQSHPINMICVPVCSPNVTANETLINDWLSNDDSTGIDQLLDHEGTVIKSLKDLSSTDVSTLLWVHVHVFKGVYIQSCINTSIGDCMNAFYYIFSTAQ